MKNKNIYWVIGLIVLGVGLILFSNKAPSDDASRSPNNSAVIESGDGESGVSESESSSLVKTAGFYEDYSPDKLERAKGGDVLLFFKASWCPTCRALDKDIEKNRAHIPENLSILKLDYDKETALKKKYSVTYQHTLVQVDANGDMIQKWSGTLTLDKVLEKL